mmetsp:Transcript_7233/g.17608  ORF Transcript_7233/g.17608 Transcript_7233/m.17608 type:complete len:204 (-) Transcript_7233:789-1400(-)
MRGVRSLQEKPRPKGDPPAAPHQHLRPPPRAALGELARERRGADGLLRPRLRRPPPAGLPVRGRGRLRPAHLLPGRGRRGPLPPHRRGGVRGPPLRREPAAAGLHGTCDRGARPPPRLLPQHRRRPGPRRLASDAGAEPRGGGAGLLRARRERRWGPPARAVLRQPRGGAGQPVQGARGRRVALQRGRGCLEALAEQFGGGKP